MTLQKNNQLSPPTKKQRLKNGPNSDQPTFPNPTVPPCHSVPFRALLLGTVAWRTMVEMFMTIFGRVLSFSSRTLTP